MPKFKHNHRTMGDVWSFETEHFRIEASVIRDRKYKYAGDDESGETQDKLNSGEYVAFDTYVRVYLIGSPEEDCIGEDSLHGSVYGREDWTEFFTAHRSADPMERNCSIMRAKHPAGPNVSICHYFPDMVRYAIREARVEIARRRDALPTLRKAA